MTPGARVAAAIEILDRINQGTQAEQALTLWARSNRFAGAKDRAAIRDHVFDVLRCKASLGGGSGRSLMARLLLRDGADLDSLFNGIGHAPAALDEAEKAALAQPLTLDQAAACDLPGWLWPLWQEALGDAAITAARAQQARADVFLRVNLRRIDLAGAIRALQDDGIGAIPHPVIATCLRVVDNARRIRNCTAYLDGLVELQDAASQRAVALVGAQGRVLDYCAGGGGKALAFADLQDGPVFAHDIAPDRMRDLPPRAARAGVDVQLLTPDALLRQAPFDVVFCDAPCSGSGTWRRSPDAKWRLSAQRLAELGAIQADVIAKAARLTGDGGLLAYATCSVLRAENDVIVDGFLQKNPGFTEIMRDLRLPDADGDGFFLSVMKKRNNL
jgi:16S rRNA (cytosine967-C5)-methyltransferase